MPLGKQNRVPVSEENHEFCLDGAFDIRTGKTLVDPYSERKTEHTKTFSGGCLRGARAARS